MASSRSTWTFSSSSGGLLALSNFTPKTDAKAFCTLFLASMFCKMKIESDVALKKINNVNKPAQLKDKSFHK